MNPETIYELRRSPSDERALLAIGGTLPVVDNEMSVVAGFIALEAENDHLRRELQVVNAQRLALMELCKKQREARKKLKVLLENYGTRTEAVRD